MLDKSFVLHQIKAWIEERIITQEDVVALFDTKKEESASVASNTGDILSHKLGVSEILYAMGALLVILGIGILIAQHWTELSDFTKILATFGSAIAAYIVGAAMNRDENLSKIGQAFFIISGVIMPLGLGVTMDVLDIDFSTFGVQSLMSAFLLTLYILSALLFKRDILYFFSIVFGTWFYFSLTSYLVGSNPFFDTLKFYEYRVLLAGLVYLLLGYQIASKGKLIVADRLYALGTFGFLGAAFALGGWKPEQNIFWELIFPGFSFIFIFLSIYVKSGSLLTLGAISLMAYIIKVTAEYFYDSLGWELSLVLAGFILMAIGYIAFRLKKKYMA